MAPFEFRAGSVPVLVSMPHSGTQLTDEVSAALTDAASKLPDTDWFIPELYPFLEELGVGMISANYSRYVIDLNRPLDDKPLYQSKTTGLFPDILFADQPLFQPGKKPSAEHQAECKAQIWRPYHQQIADELARLKREFGYAVLFDAHSIAAQVPMLFDGVLPDFNFGNNQGESCDQTILPGLESVVASANHTAGTDFTFVSNGRFKGGYITRHFGVPSEGVHAIQLELSQATYLEDGAQAYQLDRSKLSTLLPVLRALIEHLVHFRP